MFSSYPHPPQTSSHSPTLPPFSSYPGKKKLFPFIVCMCVSEKDRVPGWKIQWTCEKLPYLSSFSIFFLFLKTSRETVCALSTLSPFLYLYFLFFNLSSGFLFTHSSASKTSSLAQYTLIITNELLIQISVCDFHARGICRVTDGVRHCRRLTPCHSNMAPDVSTKMAPLKIFPLPSLLLASLIRVSLI